MEIVQMYNNHVREARKHHLCCECYGWIQPAELYHVRTYFCDGHWYKDKVCKFCNDLYNSEVADVGPAFRALYDHMFEVYRHDPELGEKFIRNALERGSTAHDFLLWLDNIHEVSEKCCTTCTEGKDGPCGVEKDCIEYGYRQYVGPAEI